jgi:hypothetical protein
MSTISASTTTTTAFKITTDTTGALVFQTGASPTTALTIDGSQRAAFVAGTAAAPAITTSGDTNTGIFFPAADTIAFAEGGTEAMRLDSSGNMGIGLTPSGWTLGRALQVGPTSALFDYTGTTYLSGNWYYGGGQKFIANGYAGQYQISTSDGKHIWTTTTVNNSSGAGAAATFNTLMTLDASGNLGLGVAPQTWNVITPLQIKNASFGGYVTGTTYNAYVGSNWYYNSGDKYISNGFATVYVQTTGQHLWYTSASGTAGNAVSFTQAMTLDSSGNFTVGATVANPIVSGVNGLKYFSSFGVLQVNSNNNAALEVGRFGGTGAFINFYYTGSGVGSISTNGSSTAYNTSSDYRLKENIAPMTDALSVVAQLRPCTYTWKSTGEAGQGFIAHELQAVVPDAVHGEKDAVNKDGSIKPQGIDTSFLVATLTAAIQELNERLEALEPK